MKRKLISIAVVGLLFVGSVTSYVFASTHQPKTDGELLWSIQYGTDNDGWITDISTPPIVVGDYVYVGQSSNLVKIDKDTGEEVGRSLDMKKTIGEGENATEITFNNYYSQTPPSASSDGKTIFLAVTRDWGNPSYAGIAAFDAYTLEIKWIMAYEGEGTTVAQTPITTYKINDVEYVMTGIEDSSLDADYNKTSYSSDFFCLDASTGEEIWKVSTEEVTYGQAGNTVNIYPVFNNTGAGVVTIDSKEYAVFGDSCGNLYVKSIVDSSAVSYGFGIINLREDLFEQNWTGLGDYVEIKSSISVDADLCYFTTSDGQLAIVELGMDENNIETVYREQHKLEGTTSANTPTVTQGSVVVGSGGGDFSNPEGFINVYKRNSDGTVLMKEAEDGTLEAEKTYINVSSQPVGEILTHELDGNVDIYAVPNDSIGGLYSATINVGEPEELTNIEVVSESLLFKPIESMQNYSTSHVIADEQGNIYYKNDSGNIFKLGEDESIILVYLAIAAVITAIPFVIIKFRKKP